MKKLVCTLLAVIICVITHAVTSPATSRLFIKTLEEPILNANSILFPIGNDGKAISLMKLSTIGIKELENLQGWKLSFFNKIGFKLSQEKLRSNINEDGTLKLNALRRLIRQAAEKTPDFHAGGFFLGLLLNVYAIPIVYLMRDENRKRRIKWMWIGLGSVVMLVLLFTFLLMFSQFK